MKTIKMKFIMILSTLIIIVLLIMQLDMINLKNRVIATVEGTIDINTIKNKEILRFYRKDWSDFCGGFVSGKIHFPFFFAIHGFNKGVVLTYYDWDVYYANGLIGGWRTFSIWHIELINDRWEIVRIREKA